VEICKEQRIPVPSKPLPSVKTNLKDLPGDAPVITLVWAFLLFNKNKWQTYS
jgi:hypothetical protein